MSRYLEYEDGQQTLIASITGWGDFCRWTNKLSTADYDYLISLVKHGASDWPTEVMKELKKALHEHPPSQDVHIIADAVIAFLELPQRGKLLYVTEGTTSEDDDHGDDAEYIVDEDYDDAPASW